MNSLRISVRRAGSVFAAAALLLGTALPGIASAAQVTERSIELSSSSADAPGVEYTINFTATQDAGAVLVEFCENSPLLGADCDAPAGFNIDTGTSVGGGFTKGTSTANKLVATGSIDVSTDATISIPVTGVHNPTTAGALYARILTYASDASGYTSADPDAGVDHLDDGGVAMYITPTIGVTGAVLEALTFCVTGGAAPGANCSLTGTTAPTLKLGQDMGNGVLALSTTVSTGDIFTQLSTNAAGGAVVSLKSNAANCGGLKLVGSTNVNNCFIAPAGTSGTIADGDAKFGVKAVAGADSGANPGGTFQAINNYDGTNYRLNGAVNNLSGVTSTYGDPILNTNGAPANGKNMTLTFAAGANNSTPAGLYSADLSLIATGKF